MDPMVSLSPEEKNQSTQSVLLLQKQHGYFEVWFWSPKIKLSSFKSGQTLNCIFLRSILLKMTAHLSKFLLHI